MGTNKLVFYKNALKMTQLNSIRVYFTAVIEYSFFFESGKNVNLEVQKRGKTKRLCTKNRSFITIATSLV